MPSLKSVPKLVRVAKKSQGASVGQEMKSVRSLRRSEVHTTCFQQVNPDSRFSILFQHLFQLLKGDHALDLRSVD